LLIELSGPEVEEDVSAALAEWSTQVNLWSVLAPSTLWGREVASRLSVRLEAGLTGDAVRLGVIDGRLVGWKPAFGGRLLAAINTTSDVSLVTVRPGVLSTRCPRSPRPLRTMVVAGRRRGRVSIKDQARNDDVAGLLAADAVICVGKAVNPEEYEALSGLREVLGAELGATRRVTDSTWLPRSRQIGLTGHCISPALYVGIGLSGKFNHMVGVLGAGTVVVVNNDPGAPAFGLCDIGIVADWHEAVPLLTEALVNERSSVDSLPPADTCRERQPS
jgi:electron transfer flavoprotein alpha subunit